MAFNEQEKDIVKLLSDYSPYISPFGGARALEETHISTAQYGPAGHASPGQQHKDGLSNHGLKMLRSSLRKMAVALALLRRQDFDAWASLIGPYLQDEADPGRVEYDRTQVRELDEENTQIRRQNEERRRLLKKGKDAPAYKDEKVRLVTARTQLERHDRAIEQLAKILEGHTLHPAPTRTMTERENVAGEKANASMNAEVNRLMASGMREEKAVEQVARAWGVSTGAVERVREFRSVLAAPECEVDGCEKPLHAKRKCQAHYREVSKKTDKHLDLHS